MPRWIIPGVREAGEQDKHGKRQGGEKYRSTEEVPVFPMWGKDARERGFVAGCVSEGTAHDAPSFSVSTRARWAVDNLEIGRAAAVLAGLELPRICGVLRGTAINTCSMFASRPFFFFFASRSSSCAVVSTPPPAGCIELIAVPAGCFWCSGRCCCSFGHHTQERPKTGFGFSGVRRSVHKAPSFLNVFSG